MKCNVWLSALLVQGYICFSVVFADKLQQNNVVRVKYEIDSDHTLANLTSDVGLNVLQLIRKYGYPLEIHQNVTTADGYLLDLHRIPHGRQNERGKNKPVVLLAHCLLCSSAEWIYMGPKRSLGYILADRGYDVWMGNNRGTTWSRKHVSLNPDEKNSSFWNFSFHEMGIFDLPAIIDYILDETGQEKLFLTGFSQGTTSTFIMLSEKPEYNSKIRLAAALAPAAYMGHNTNIVFSMFVNFPIIIRTLRYYGINELVPNGNALVTFGGFICSDESRFQLICRHVLAVVAGRNHNQLNLTMLPVIATSTPAGCSLNQLAHYVQEIISGEFRQFDHGMTGNLRHYGTPDPPKYNLKNVAAPVSVHYGQSDDITAPQDAERLIKDLPNVVDRHLLEDWNWNHLDFVWSAKAPTLLYDRIFKLMAQY